MFAFGFRVRVEPSISSSIGSNVQFRSILILGLSFDRPRRLRREKDAQKERKKQEAKEKAEKLKADNAEKNFALKLVGLASKLSTELEACINHEAAKKCPSWAVKNARESHKAVNRIRDAARARVHQGEKLTVTAEQASIIQKDAVAATKAISGMIKEAVKHTT